MHPSDFAELYNTSVSYLRQLVFSIVKDVQATEDVLQDIYLAAWLRFHRGPHPNPLGWLTLTARHKACDHLRRSLRKSEYLFTCDLSAEYAVARDLLYATDKRLDAVCEDVAPYGRVSTLLRKEELTLLIEHYELGFSISELAQKYHLSTSACHMRIHRAKKKLESLRPTSRDQHCP